MKRLFLLCLSALALSGCATPTQMVLDAEVRRLCAIDGGIKVYETVALPADKFNQWGQINFYQPTQGENSLGPDYVLNSETQRLVTASDAASHDLRMLRQYYSIVRSRDEKLLGESVFYARGGGDITGPWHPSSFNCPSYSEAGILTLFKKVFVRSIKGSNP